MAARSYHIISDYHPPSNIGSAETLDFESLELEAARDALAWSEGRTSKRITHPPKFVKPSGLYDGHGRLLKTGYEDDDEIQIIGHKPSDISSWYQGLERGTTPTTRSEEPTPTANALTGLSEAASGTNPKSSDDKPPWFLSRALNSQPSSNKTPPILSSSSSSSSLAGMLARAPPPLPSEAPFIPPVFTVLGPANQGYALLERLGWEEGKPLGSRRLDQAVKKDVEDELHRRTGLGKRQGIGFKGSARANEVIDLTAAESDDDDFFAGPINTLEEEPGNISPHGRGISRHDGQALLTPLPTVLKGDRAGIGSTSGVKRSIKHTSDALLILERKKQKRRNAPPRDGSGQISGGGAHRFVKMAKTEARDRAALLASLNE